MHVFERMTQVAITGHQPWNSKIYTQIPDVQIPARRGLLFIRRGKGLKHREVPLVQEAREPLDAYFIHRHHLAERWRERAKVRGRPFLPRASGRMDIFFLASADH